MRARERKECLDAEKTKENEIPEIETLRAGFLNFFFFMGRVGLNLGTLFLG